MDGLHLRGWLPGCWGFCSQYDSRLLLEVGLSGLEQGVVPFLGRPRASSQEKVLKEKATRQTHPGHPPLSQES